MAINVKTGMPPFGILADHKIKMCHNSMQKIMIQKITQNNWNFWTVNLIMRAKKIVNHSSDFPVRRTGLYRHKKALHNILWHTVSACTYFVFMLSTHGGKSSITAIL